MRNQGVFFFVVSMVLFSRHLFHLCYKSHLSRGTRGQKHNGIDCALCPTAKRACDRAWVTAKNLEEWSGMSKTTMWRWLERIEKARRISRVSDMKHVDMSTSTGAVKTTLYNLNVLNQLAMVCIDNEKLNDISCKFSDILSEVETTGSYRVQNSLKRKTAGSMVLPAANRRLTSNGRPAFFSVFGVLSWFLRRRRRSIYFDFDALVFPIAFDAFDAERPSLRQCFLE